MKTILILCAVLLLAFVSCKKDKDDETNCTLSATSIIGSYKITAVTYKASASLPEQDVYNDFFDEDCEKDDILTLNTNNTFNYADVGVTCSPEGNYDGNWSLSGNAVIIDGDQGTIENFTCNSFILTGQNVITSGDKLNITYTRQ